MSIEIKDIELIDRYLGGDLKGSELQAFQERLQSDVSFKELLSDFQATNELVKFNELAQVQAQLNSFSYESAPWWQSTTTKILAVAGVAAVVTTAVWMSSSDNKPVAKDTVAVTQKESVKEHNNKSVSPASEKSSVPQKSEKKTYIQHSSDYTPVTPDRSASQEENTAPLHPVTVPTGPAVPPQQAPAVPSPSQPKPAPQETAPATDPAIDAQEPPAPQPEIKKHFMVQVPGQNWEYPEHMRNGKLTIMNEAGALIYEINVNASTESWNATDRYGNMVPAGLYFYQYTDVSGKNYSGTVTVAY